MNKTWKNILFDFLKGKFITLVIKKVLGTAAMGGFKVWIVKYIATNFYEEIGEPLMRWGLGEAGFVLNKIEGKMIVNRIDKARTDGNETDYDDAVSDSLN